MTARPRSPQVLEGEVVAETTDPPAPTTLVTVGKFKVLMRRPNDTQIAVLTRLGRAAEREPEKFALRLFTAFFGIIESLLVNEDDAYILEDAMVKGELEAQELTAGLTATMPDAAEDATPAPRTRRARAR